MNSRQRRVLLVGAVCALAISLSAATLDSTVSPVSGGDGGVENRSSGPPVTAGEHPLGTGEPPCVSWLATPWAALGFIATLGGVALLVRRRYSRFEAVALMGGVGVPALALYLLLTRCAFDATLEPIVERLGRLPAGPPVVDAASGSDPVIPAMLLGVVLLVGLLIVAAMLYVSLGDRDAEPSDVASGDDDSDGAAAALAAGDAADRIQGGGDLETEIHRAWRDMAAHLDVPRPEASTPGEFAERAIESGLSADAVRELTALFEEVRYGGFEATVGRERRAQTALRRIEDGGDADGTPTGTSSAGWDR